MHQPPPWPLSPQRELAELEDSTHLHRSPRRVPVGLGHALTSAALGQFSSVSSDALRWEAEEAERRQPLPPDSQLAALAQPPSCAFLRAGQTFRGWQRVSAPGKGEQWSTAVTIQAYDHASGKLSGTMTATSVPLAVSPVVTFFEGDVIDNVNSSFYTTDWAATAETDLRHWERFRGFLSLRRDVLRYGGRAPGLAASGKVFMRWKELFFVSGGECRLTIQGFYYATLDRATGSVEAFYYDPASTPDQRVCLEACTGHAGYSFPAHEIA